MAQSNHAADALLSGFHLVLEQEAVLAKDEGGSVQAPPQGHDVLRQQPHLAPVGPNLVEVLLNVQFEMR